MNDELPKGWASALLSGIAEINPRHPKGLDDSMPISFVRMAAVSESKPGFDSLEERTLGEVRKGFTHFAEGDVLFAKITPCMENGKGAVARGLRNKLGCGTTELHVVRPLADISPEYIYRFLAQDRVRRAAKENFTGTAGQARVPTSFIEELQLPIPPLGEQRRIVAKLETLLGKVDASQQRLAKIPVLLKRFRQSVLAAACSGRLTADWREENPNVEPASEILSHISKEKEKVKLREAKKITDAEELDVPFDIPSTWALCFFDDLAAAKPNAIKAGPFGSSLTKACYVLKGFKVYGQEQVINGDPNFGDYYISQEKFRELQSCEVFAGDILVSLVGTIGKVLVIPKQFQPGIINPRLAKFSLHPSIVRGYIANYLLSTLAKNIMAQQSHGGTMEILNLGIMRKLPIPLAPLPEQQEIVRRVEGLFALADQLEVRLEKARSRVCGITPSLLARAFAGKLVPQDPNDEPASELLARI